MDYAFERDWQTLVKRMMERFGEEPDVTSMVFAVGLQEAGQGARRYKKDEKMDLMRRRLHLARAAGSLRQEGKTRRGVAPLFSGGAHSGIDARGTRDDDEEGLGGLFRGLDWSRG